MNGSKVEKDLEKHIVEYQARYCRLAYSYVKNTEDALDIIQESIYKAFSSIDSLKNPEYMKTWLYRIVVNTSLDFLRKKKINIKIEDKIIRNTELMELDKYENLDLKTALEELPEKYKSVIILRFFEDLKIEEIAEVLNENINTVKTRLYRGLDKLKIIMD